MEDRIRCAKASGLRDVPFGNFMRIDAWLAMVMIPQDAAGVSIAGKGVPDGALERAEPTTLR